WILKNVAGVVCALAMTSTAVAGPVVLRQNPVDDDGRVTLGDLFEGAGSASEVVVAQRSGPSVVLEAGQLQAMARQAGLDWANPNGLRRVAVRRALGPVGPQASGSPVLAATQHPSAARPASAGQQVIARNDMVRVTYQLGGVSLSVM
ncbi:hypothetical protein LTR94_030979, partial [Friedmanniomyces endolithicus]